MYSEDQLRQIHDIEIILLNEVERICNKHNIRYFAIGGTALGAVRHHGFIPWDDDLDIGMLREDYNKFLRVCENELSPGFFLQTHKTEPMSPFYFSKLRLDGTKFVEKYVRKLKIHQGIFLDIFPYDNIPDNRWAEIIQRLKVDFLSQFVIARRVQGTSVELAPFKKVFAFIYRCVFRAASFLMNMDKVISLIDRESTKYNNMQTQYVSYVRLPFLKMKSEWIDSFVYYQFENTQIPCPQGVNLYLRNHFGNYMQMPPESKRVGHSPFVLDLGRWANMLSPTDRTTTETE
jgi:lipopolysaccharide cholinephosphotransferase